MTKLSWTQDKTAEELEKNKKLNGVYPADESEFLIWREKEEAKPLLQTYFHMKKMSLFQLPQEMEILYNYNNLVFLNDLRCKFQSMGLDGCKNKFKKPDEKMPCWCLLIDQIIKTGRGSVAFLCKRASPLNVQQYNNPVYMMVDGILVPNQKGELMTQKKSEMIVKLTIDFGHSIISYRSSFGNGLTIDIINCDNILEKVFAETSIGNTTIKHQCRKLPRKIVLYNYSTIYSIPEERYCNYGEIESLPIKKCPEDGKCFCNLVNQIRANGSGFISFMLNEMRDGKDVPASYKIKMEAARYPDDHNKLQLNFSYEYDSNFKGINHNMGFSHDYS